MLSADPVPILQRLGGCSRRAVLLDEGVRILSNLVDTEPADVRIGLEVEVAFEPTVADMAVPVFRPRGDR